MPSSALLPMSGRSAPRPGGFYGLAAIVYAVRRRLIVDQMARMFGKMVYDMRKKHSDDE